MPTCTCFEKPQIKISVPEIIERRSNIVQYDKTVQYIKYTLYKYISFRQIDFFENKICRRNHSSETLGFLENQSDLTIIQCFCLQDAY